ncbi:hypothetical protein [Sorangium sp. So ce233]|uniref:hypothetical protein n=1 Tax=Sorangium sp. So ce233 TaxID=3133290 RepID=UPI003F6317DE
MAKTWNSAIEAKVGGSLCSFQVDFQPSIPIPGLPTIPTINFPPPLPFADLECPLDDADEEVPTT